MPMLVEGSICVSPIPKPIGSTCGDMTIVFVIISKEGIHSPIMSTLISSKLDKGTSALISCRVGATVVVYTEFD